MEERDFDRDAIDTDSLESEVMELICSYIQIIKKKKKESTDRFDSETENRVRVECQIAHYFRYFIAFIEKSTVSRF